MKKYNENLVILSLGIFILLSIFYLAFTEDRIHNYDLEKDWWIVYFEDPKGDSLDFIIENHSNSNDFKYQVFLEKNKIYEDTEIINKGSIKKIPVKATDISKKKILVKVFSGEKIKEIYKITSN